MAKKTAKNPPKTAKKAPAAPSARLALVDSIKKGAFLAAYAEAGNIARAAIAAGCTRAAHYKWLDEADYRKQFDDAQEEAADRLEEEARRRAVEGVRRLKFHSGEAVLDPETGKPYVEHEYSDALLIFLLKGLRPEKFAQRIKTDVAAAPEEFDPAKLQLLRQAGLIIVEAEVSAGNG